MNDKSKYTKTLLTALPSTKEKWKYADTTDSFIIVFY